MSRYSHPCPACGVIIRPSEIPYGDSFSCPACGEWLKYDSKYTLVICIVSFLVATILAWHMGYRDAMLVFVTICATALLSILGAFFEGVIHAPGFKRVQGKAFDKTPSLFVKDKPEADKKTNP